MKRTKQREQAFSLIFESLFNKDEPECKRLYEENIEQLGDYSKLIYSGVCEKADELDETISSHLRGWKIGRIPKTDLAILRLAVYEIEYVDEIAPPVAVNEAVELAKKYSGENDPAFVNAVLGAILREK